MTGEDVKRMMDAGATLVQVYTGFVYNGAGFAGDLCRSLIAPEAPAETQSNSEVVAEETTENQQ
jgi:dihydroorotate dehydrogenase